MTDATTHHERTSKAKLTPEQEAQKDARDIHNTLQHGTASAAYDLMLKEISTAKTDFKPGSKDFVAYRNTLAKELKQTNDYIELAPVWGQKAFHKLSVTNSSHSDTVTQRELSPYVNGALPTDVLTKSFASALRDKIKDSPVTYEELGRMSKEGDKQRTQAISTAQEYSRTEDYAKKLDSKAKNGKTLFELADAAGAINKPGNLDGNVGKQDIDALLSLGKAGLVPLRDWEKSYLSNLSANWDKPEVKNLRSSVNQYGVKVPGDFISAESLTFAKSISSTVKSDSEAEEAAIDNHDHMNLAIKNNVELLREHKAGNGKSLLEAADTFGGHADGLVGKQDIDALLQASKNGLINLRSSDKDALQSISDGWNRDLEVFSLRRFKTKEGGEQTGQYITTDSLRLANGDIDREAQNHNAVQSKRIDQANVEVRTQAVDYAGQLENLKFGNKNLFNAADVLGGTNNHDRNDKKVSKHDLEALASTLLAVQGAESKEYLLAHKLVTDWDTPAVRAMRGDSEYLTPESMKNVSLY